VIELINGMDGLRALDAGSLAVSRLVEGITPLLLNLMLRNKMKNLGIRFL